MDFDRRYVWYRSENIAVRVSKALVRRFLMGGFADPATAPYYPISEWEAYNSSEITQLFEFMGEST